MLQYPIIDPVAISVGPEVSDVAGNLMDQDGDGVLGEAGEDVFTASVTLEDRPVFEAHYDFGTSTSAVTSGFTDVPRYHGQVTAPPRPEEWRKRFEEARASNEGATE